MRLLLLVVSLVLLSTGRLPNGATQATFGGDPAVILYAPSAGSDVYLGDQPSLAIASTGVLFTACTRTVTNFGREIVVFRSEDHGVSWSEWSVIGGAASGESLHSPEL